MNRNNKNIAVIVSALVIGLLLGWLFFGGNGSSDEATHDHTDTEDVIWTCSMHPEIRSSEPGNCPKCGMELIPVGEAGSPDSDIFQMSEDAMKLANIRTMTVGTDAASREMRLNGKVAVDERNTYSQSTHIPGRIERLHVNFTGESVNRGQTLAVVYSPELVTAQEELLQAYSIREAQPQLYAAVREKLSNWRISNNLMDRIVSSGKPIQSFPISADVSGVVMEKFVELGDYVERGMPLYTISDLSKIWVLFDIYESQMPFVREGAEIEFTVSSLPGETFQGEVSFIDPLLNNATRVATARVEVDNHDGKLKPEMFASGMIDSQLQKAGEQEIVVPESAVLWTGKRSLVYVKEEIGDQVGFQLRQVVLGPSLGDTYIIEEGLTEGEEIVVNGTFTVDAAVQLSGRPSMMNPEGLTAPSSSAPEKDIQEFLDEKSRDVKNEIPVAFQDKLSVLLNEYLDFKDALVSSNYEEGRARSMEFSNALQKMETAALSGEMREFWNQRKASLQAAAKRAREAKNLEELRQKFVSLSEEMIRTFAVFGSNNQSIFVDYCPMANSDEGAYWLSKSRDIRNPYFGEAMLTCGEIVKELN